MRVSGRALALGFLVGVYPPAAALAAPIAPTTCTVLQAASCTPTRIADPFSPATFDGEFATGDDLYLFLLHFDDDVQFTATTTSFALGNFDPTLALYDGGGSILQLPDPSGPGSTIAVSSNAPSSSSPEGSIWSRTGLSSISCSIRS